MFGDLSDLTAGYVVIDPTERILLVRRKKGEQFSGTLGLPAGHVRLREGAATAALRELLEETGLPSDSVRFTGYVGAYWVDASTHEGRPNERRAVMKFGRATRMIVFAAICDKPVAAAEAEWLSLDQVEQSAHRSELAPNVFDAVRDAIALKRQPHKFIASSELKAIVTGTRQRLLDTFESTSQYEGGWNHYLDEPGVGVLATAMGLITCVNIGIPCSSDVIRKSVEYLKRSALLGGGWGTRLAIKITGGPITECTAWSMLALSNVLPPDDDVLSRAVDWLTRTQRPEDSMWSSTEAARNPNVYATTLAIRALYKVAPTHPSLRRASAALAISQHDNGWGIHPGDKPSPVHTAHSILALLECDPVTHQTRIFEASKWLRQQATIANTDALDCSEIQTAFGPEDGPSFRLEIKHYGAPWIGVALLACGDSVADPTLQALMQSVIQNQTARHGAHWLAGWRPVVWAFHDSSLFAVQSLTAGGSQCFASLEREAMFRDDMIRMSSDINVLYLKERAATRLPHFSILLNVFLLLLISFRLAIQYIPLLPAPPWYIEMPILAIITAVADILLAPVVGPVAQKILRLVSPVRKPTID